MLKGDVCRAIVEKDQSFDTVVLINLGANRFVEPKRVMSYFDLLKLKRVKTIDTRIIPMILSKSNESFQHINYGMIESYFDISETFKPISLKKVKKLR